MEACARPTAVRIRFEIVDVVDGEGGLQLHPRIEVTAKPSFTVTAPMKWVSGVGLLAPAPACFAPKAGTRVALLVHEGGELCLCLSQALHSKGLDWDWVGRLLIVEEKGRVRRSPEHKRSSRDMGVPLRPWLRRADVRGIRGDSWVSERLPGHPKGLAVHVFMEDGKEQEIRLVRCLG